MTPEETLAIETLTLEKVKRSARVLVSNALLDGAHLQMVPDMLAQQITSVMFTTEVFGKKETSEWSTVKYDEFVTAPGIWNNIKASLAATGWRWLRDIAYRRKVFDLVTAHHHAVYHVCPHVNEWTETKALHLKWLASAPKPAQEDN